MKIQPEGVIVLQVDTILQTVTKHSYADPLEKIELKGQGGTDSRPSFA